MTREQKYRAQMEALGIYDPIFEPELTTLCQLEREHQSAKKAWSATALPAGSRPSFLDPHYSVIQRLRQEILQHREALGLTPKALRKLRGQPAELPSQQDQITAKLDLIARRVSEYDNYHPGLAGPDGDLTLEQYAKKYGVPEYDAAADPGFGDKIDDLQGYLSNKAPEPTAAEGGALGRALRRSGSADKPGRDPDPQAGAAYETLPDAQDAIRISDRIDAELAHAVAEDMG